MAFKFELCSPEKIIFEGLVTRISVPGEEGDMVILENHTSINALVRPGAVVFQSEKHSKNHSFFVRDALLTVRSEGVKILAQTILDLETLDKTHIAEQIRSVAEDVRDAKTEADRHNATLKHHHLKEIYDALETIKESHQFKMH
jgi:F-type H+-transporting ATPase subunit epsilon